MFASPISKHGTYLPSEVTTYHQGLRASAREKLWLIHLAPPEYLALWGSNLLQNSSFSSKAEPTTSLASSRSLERAVIHNCGEMLVHRMSTCPPPRNQRSVRAWYNCSSLLPSRSPQRISILLTNPQSRCNARFSSATSVFVDLYVDCNTKCEIFTFNIMDVAQFSKFQQIRKANAPHICMKKTSRGSAALHI